MSGVKAADIYDAVYRHTSGALVPEVVLEVPEYIEPEGDPRMKPYRRIDGLMFETLTRTAVEIKVSMADLRRETPHKWWPWRNVTHRFIYAIPYGMCDWQEVIDATGNYWAGVWGIHEDGRVEVLRRAKVRKHPEPLPQQVVQAMAYRIHRSYPRVGLDAPENPEENA